MTDAFDVDIEYLDASGDGIARLDRATIAIPFTIPGERVRVSLGDCRRDASRPIPAALIDVLRPSKHRVQPGCRHFGPGAAPIGIPCGGCSWQHIAYPEQLRLKSSLVARLLSETLGHPPPVAATHPGTPGAPWAYRHKAHFVFASSGSGRRAGALTMGHYARGSRRAVPIEECPVHHPRGNRVAFQFFHTFSRAGIVAAPAGALRSIAVRTASATPEVFATLVVTSDTDSRLRSATRRAMKGADSPDGLHLNIHRRGDAFVFGPDTRTIAGPLRLREEVAGTSFLISPTAFFQTNVHAAEILVQLVLEAVPADAQVLDLYAGAGLFALPLARRGHTVIAVEENRAAVADGEASARLNRVSSERCRFVARRVESALTAIRRADVVVLDPPREGCSPGVIDDILGRLRPRGVVYISCNPEALARDLRTAASFPYVIEAIQPVDMFPHTAHIETVATIVRRDA